MKTRTAACLLIASLSLSAAYGGISYTAATQVQNGTNAAVDSVKITAQMEGQSGRMEFSGSGAMATNGAYMVTKDAGQTMYLVNPTEKTYMKWDINQVFGFAQGFMTAAKAIVSYTVTNVVVEQVLEEKGPELQGYPTRHYKVKTSYATETRILGMRRASKVEREDDIWSTAKLIDPAMTMWRSQNRITTGNEEMDKLLRGEMEKVQGFPLKKVSVSITTPAKGKPETTLTSMEVTEIKQGAIPASAFEWPADYTEVSLAQAQSHETTEEQPAKTAPAGNPFKKMIRSKIGLGN
jgi:hypothetical protein